MFRLEVKHQIEEVLKKLTPEYDRDNAWEIVDIIEREYMGIEEKTQDKINQLKQQCAEDLEIKDNLVKMQSKTIQHLEREVTKFDGYRQAVKDILGSKTKGVGR